MKDKLIVNGKLLSLEEAKELIVKPNKEKEMYYIKNITLKPAEGGYIICCDKHKEQPDSYDGMRYMGEHKIVVEDPTEAMEIVDELFNKSVDGGLIELPEPNSESGNKGTNLISHD